MARRLLVLGWAASAALGAQGLPLLPPPSELREAPAQDLLPLRPLGLEDPAQAGPPFTWRGERVREEGGVWTLEQGAIQSPELLLLADRIRFDRVHGDILAEGNIRLEAKGLRLRCERLAMDWKLRTGEAHALVLELAPTWVLRSDDVTFATFRRWDFRKVEVSPCPQENPGWKAVLADLRLDLDGFATFAHPRIWLDTGLLPVPIFYVPWAAYPAQASRSSGLLPPLIGVSSRLGLTLGPSYFQTLGNGADLTVAPEFFSKEGVLWGGETRWNPEPTHQGSFQGEAIHERSTGDHRYRYTLKEVWQREDGWQLSMDLNQASDALMDSDYGRGIGRLGTNTFDSAFYLGKSFPLFNLALRASDQRTFFLPQDPFYQEGFPGSLTRRTLPQVEARLYPIPLGRFYLDADLRIGKLGYLIQVRDDQPQGRFNWGRDDLAVRLHGRLGQWGPVRVDVEALGRLTRYGATLREDAFSTSGTEGGITDPFAAFRVDAPGTRRLLGSARIQFSGPQVGQTFEEVNLLGYHGELRHLVEPFVGFTQTSRFADAGRIARFDDVDIQPGVEGSADGERSVELGMKQHVLGRGGSPSPFTDLIRWKVSSRYHFSPILVGDGRVKRGWASLENSIDIEPHEAFRLSFKRSADLVDGGSDDSLSAEYRGRDGSRYSLAAFSTGINHLLVRQRGIQVAGTERFLDDRIRLEFQASYDLHQGAFSNSQAGLAYVTPCVATSLRFSHLGLQLSGQNGRENRLDLVLTLRGLGDLFSLRQ